jgi:hypothetical protein
MCKVCALVYAGLESVRVTDLGLLLAILSVFIVNH